MGLRKGRDGLEERKRWADGGEEMGWSKERDGLMEGKRWA